MKCLLREWTPEIEKAKDRVVEAKEVPRTGSLHNSPASTIATAEILLQELPAATLKVELVLVAARGRRYKLQPEAEQELEDPAILAGFIFPNIRDFNTSFYSRPRAFFMLPSLWFLLFNVNPSCAGALELHISCEEKGYRKE